MKLTWFGHSAFALEIANAKILIDPFLKNNPKFENDDFDKAIDGTTHIAITHGHADHVGDAVDIAQKTGAPIIANYDLCSWLATKGAEKIDPGHTGGTLNHDGFSVTFVQAQHGASIIDENGVSQALGPAQGLVFHIDGDKTLYHMGDTDIFGDMALIAELHQPQVGIVPIGDRFTMGSAVAALACRRYFKFDTVIPCHFGTFPVLEETPDTFLAAMEDDAQKVRVMKIGQAAQA